MFEPPPEVVGVVEVVELLLELDPPHPASNAAATTIAGNEIQVARGIAGTLQQWRPDVLTPWG